MKALAQLLYGLNGLVFLALGVGTMLYGTPWLPEIARRFMSEFSHGNDDILHFTQEVGSLLIAFGVIALWFTLHFEQSRVFHWAMLLFWGLFATVHFVDPYGHLQLRSGAWITAIPFAMYVLLSVLRRRG